MGFGWALHFKSFPLCMFCLHVCKHTLCMQVPTEPECIGCPGMEIEDGSAKRVLGTEPRTSEQAVGALNICTVHPGPGAIVVLFCFVFSKSVKKTHCRYNNLFST